MSCSNHPDRPAIAQCQKFGLAWCAECCHCADPKGYCKHRTACIAWHSCERPKQRARREAERQAEDGSDQAKPVESG